jgi:hypothetical protein
MPPSQTYCVDCGWKVPLIVFPEIVPVHESRPLQVRLLPNAWVTKVKLMVSETLFPDTVPVIVPVNVDVMPLSVTVVGTRLPVMFEPFWVRVRLYAPPEFVHVPVTVDGGVGAGGSVVVVVVGVVGVVAVVVVVVVVVVVGAVGDELLPPHAATVIARIRMGAIRMRNIMAYWTDSSSLFPSGQW